MLLLWDNIWDVSLLGYSKDHVDVLIKDGEQFSWHFISLYGQMNEYQRKFTWDLLERLMGI